MKFTNIAILLTATLAGCAANRAMVLDYRLYDTGEVQETAWVESEGNRQSGSKNEYFKNGHLKRLESSRQGKPLMVVEFHENGQMKSEERFRRNEIAFGAYYSEDGALIQQVGEKVYWREEGEQLTNRLRR